MTEITLDTEKKEIPTSIIKVFAGILMVTSIYGAGSLLNWAVQKKLVQIESVESSNITVAVRERQLACLAKNIYYEAGGEPFEGKVAVAQVTMNRAASGKFPAGICEVIYQKNLVYEKVICQFSWFCDRQVQFRPVNQVDYNESMEVAKKVLLEDFRLPSLKTALFYHADYINPQWGKEKVAKIGHHIFYK
jgi:spore germination cell wall hydrolase CwlJ-like protein